MSKKDNNKYTNTILLAVLIGLSGWSLFNIHHNGVAIGKVQTDISYLKDDISYLKKGSAKETTASGKDIPVTNDRLAISEPTN